MPTPSKTLAAVALAALVAVAAAAGAGEIPSDTRPLRRNRIVEVFEEWKESVVFVTGPIVKGENSTLAEFFTIGESKLKESSVGTGFVIHESGYVVTNAHGVEKSLVHLVFLDDRKNPVPAELVAVLHEQDLALLKVSTNRPLKPVRLAKSGDLMIGETIVVIANPHALRCTCTAGILSAIGRATHLADVPGVTLQDMIQSDAGINPGSSGGPWFNVAGEVMGMTASMKKDAENIAFAVSATTLRKMLPQMLDVERRYRIASGLEVTPDGVCQVKTVEPSSPAAKAGLRPGDAITSLAGRPTPTSLDWFLALAGRKAGESLTVEFARGGRTQRTTLTLESRPKPDVDALLQEKLGLKVAPLEVAKAKTLGLRVPRGLIVTRVDPLMYEKVQHPPQPGDILARIGLIRPRGPEQAADLVETLQRGQAVDMVFLRRQETRATRIDVHLIVPR